MSWLFEPERPWRPLDAALADQLRRRWPAIAPELLRLLARASLATSEGHSALDPAAFANGSADYGLPAWPAERWLQLLADCPAVASTGDAGDQPFVVDAGLLYLRRLHRAEVTLARGLRALAQPLPVAAAAAVVRQALARWFPPVDDLGEDRQALACLLSLRARLTVILGGPGTGKTTTVMRLIALHQELAGRPLRVVAAAPTGKAAARVGEAMLAAASALKLGVEALQALLPQRPQTLHRLLGADPQGTRFRHGAANPLPYDLVVLDEASMVDLGMFARLVSAIGPATRLIVLGDPDQLEAVESGAVLAELASLDEAAPDRPGAGIARARRIRDHGPGATGGDHDAAPVADCVIRLLRGYRFAGDQGIAALAAAVLAGDAAAVQALLRDPPPDLRYRPQGADALAATLRGETQRLYSARDLVADPGAALASHAGARVLAATRAEVAMANRRIAGVLGLGDTGAVVARHGLPFLVTRNDPLRDLHNGDTGVFMAHGGPLRAWLAQADGGIRDCAVHEIGPWLPALAMTVHRAQGSEYDRVLLILPPRDLPLLSRQWLYTAITRARVGVELWAPPDVLTAAIARRAQRLSGLARRLQERPGKSSS